ncbi:MAG: TetR family transcriptional regulator [Burkholderiaceae bacterium]|jgi:AcrR family transcriptional regulator|nr:TetR family transcriptional regulator [Pseudomonadota bacterium]MBS0596677.1 TetR family transcriptional regulator [Pseudomonadota bacterium]MCO5115091.1 TetR family transcriptional regulator [Burkholderiaceae bacterium]MCP5218989.1 TetR family transcriptional regulator [Burkholderiaceae bacterium]
MASISAELDSKGRDPERSKAAILSAARDEFAGHGLAGARIDRIAARAELNKRLIYYYFKSKDDLFLAVLEHVYAEIRGAEQRLHLLDMEPTEAVRRLIEFTWNYFIEHPEFITLLASANLHQARHLQRSSRVQEMNSPVIQTLGDVLERGRKSGVFRGGVDPVQLYISIAGIAYFYLSNKHTLSAIFGRDLMSPKARAERLGHMCDVILGYVLRS